MITCLHLTDRAYPIKLEQHEGGKKLFRVTYGLQVDDNLTYTKATGKLGQAIMHALACEGLVDNGGA